MATRATIASAATVVTTRATITSIGSAIGGTATGFAAGAEIAELAGEFGIERIVEADGDRTVTGGHGLGRTTGGSGRRCSRGRAVATLGNGFHEAPGVRLTLPFSSISSTIDFDLLAERQHVFDVVDALALAQLGDVHETVAAREDVDERTELGDVDNPAQ